MPQTTIQAQGEYYPRRSLRGRITLVRNINRRQSMMDRLTTPFMRGVYSGGLVVGAVGGMAMMRRRAANEAAISQLKKGAASFSMQEQRAATSYRRRSKNGKISIISKQSSSNPLPLIRSWEDVKKDPLGVAPIVRYSRRLQLMSQGNKQAIALNNRDSWGMKAFD